MSSSHDWVYADITLETVALDTPNNVAVFITDAPAKHAATIYPLSKLNRSPIFWFFHMWLSLNTITNALMQALQSVNKWKNIQCCNGSSFNVTNTNTFYSSISTVSIILFAPCMFTADMISDSTLTE
jgi:hypothetical protein